MKFDDVILIIEAYISDFSYSIGGNGGDRIEYCVTLNNENVFYIEIRAKHIITLWYFRQNSIITLTDNFENDFITSIKQTYPMVHLMKRYNSINKMLNEN
jgi:hypothetical protein